MATRERPELVVRSRKVFAKRVRFLRRQGLIPANLYGPGIDSLALEVEASKLHHVLALAGRNTPVQLNVEGDGRREVAFLWEIQRHPVTDEIIHVDFFKADLTRQLRTTVPIQLIGRAPAATKGASILQILNELDIECPALEIPPSIEVDIASLEEPNDLILVKDIEVKPPMTILSSPEQPVVRAAPPRVEEVVEATPLAEAVTAEKPATPEEEPED